MLSKKVIRNSLKRIESATREREWGENKVRHFYFESRIYRALSINYRIQTRNYKLVVQSEYMLFYPIWNMK